ncbi:MAG: hypothetical protein M1839_006158 [Geoglossum umbratile]|nr:MAG: hypothetical protein M1839_006158 [Geoglossum umbratile]
MWKRRPIHNRPRDPIISHPILIDTSLDRETLNEFPSISEMQNRRDARLDLLSGQRSEEGVKGLPPLPPQPEQSQQRPVSDIPTASSIYSQATPDLQQHNHSLSKPSRPQSAYSDVSPPDSPEMSADRGFQERYRRSPSISPIEERFEIPELPTTRSSKYASNIPVLRREKMRNQSRPVAKERNLGDGGTDNTPRLTRWDEFSGEPTIGDSGKTPAAWSGSHSRDPASEDGTRLNIHSTAARGRRISGQDTQADTSHNLGRAGFGLSLGARGDWRSTFGRFSRSNTTDNKPPPASESIPRSTDRPSPYGDDSWNSRHSGVTTDLYAQRERGRASPSPLLLEHDDGVKPIVPLKAGRNSPPRILTSPMSLNVPTSLSSPASGDPKSTPGGARRDSRNKPLPTPVSDDPDSGPGGIETKFRYAMRSIQKPEPNTSRFSATTYATGTTYDTPPTTPKVDSPDSGKSSPPSPILSRRRPIPTSNEKAVTRKPSPSQDESSPSSPTKISTTLSKSLPQSPPEAQAGDLLTTLQAQLDDLHTRRSNLQKILRELSLLLPPNPSTHNVSARDEMKKRVDDHKMELAEIQKEEHEVGLRLHRAWRRRDKQNELGEPTGLWVRRVTG